MIVKKERACVLVPRYRMSHNKVDNLTSDVESSETLLKKETGIKESAKTVHFTLIKAGVGKSI